MWAEEWNTGDLESEGWPMSATCYRTASSYVTQIESSPSGALTRWIVLTVGG